MFGRATIRLGIGPHSIVVFCIVADEMNILSVQVNPSLVYPVLQVQLKLSYTSVQVAN